MARRSPVRRLAMLILLLAVACASSRPLAPRSASVFVAPTVHPGYPDDSLARELVAEFDRSLRLGIDMVHVEAADDADYVVQPVVSFAAVELGSSHFYGEAVNASWKETLIGSVTVTARTDPTNPRVLPVQCTSVDGGFFATMIPLPMLLESMKGCRIDPATGAVTTAAGSPAWLPGIMFVNLRSGDLFLRLRFPTKQIPPHELDKFFFEDPGYELLWPLTRLLTIRSSIDNSGPGAEVIAWRRIRSVLLALAARQRLRDEELDETDRRLLSSLLDWVAHPGDDEGPFEHEWDPPSYAELHRWLVARMRDDYDAFREGYKALVSKGVEPEFCKDIYERWPPNASVFRNAYAPATTKRLVLPVSAAHATAPQAPAR